MNQNSLKRVEHKCKLKNDSYNFKFLNNDNHVKTLLPKCEQLRKELNEVKNKQQKQDVKLDKNDERLENHEGKINLKGSIEDVKHTLIQAFPNIPPRKRSESINKQRSQQSRGSTDNHNNGIVSQESSKNNKQQFSSFRIK